MRKTMKRTGFIAVSALALTSVGIAYAAWTANGTGTGSADADTAQAVNVTAAAAAGDLLHPGGSADLIGDLVNDNDYPVTVVVTEVASSIASGDTACDAGHGVTATIATTVHEVDANDTLEDALIGTLQMSNNSNNACFGETFTVDVTTVAESDAS